MHGGKAISGKIFALVTDVTGLDEISDAYFARDFGGWDMQVPTATKSPAQGETCPLGPPTAAMG